MGRNMALGVVGRGLRDVVILSVSALAAVWTLQHRDLVREALGIELPSVQIGSKGEGAADRKDRKPGFERSLSLRAGTNGHFNTRAEMNGRSVDVMVDTGASLVSLSYEDARSAGIYLNDADFKYRSSTANGTARIAIVTLDRVQIGDIEVRDVQAAVAEPGKLGTTLLGMSFLSKLRRFEMRGSELLLVE